MLSKGMIEKDLNELKNWDLKWALAAYAGIKEITTIGASGFGVITGNYVVIPGKNGKPEKRIKEVRPYSEHDHCEILNAFDLKFEEVGIEFVYRVDGVGEFRSIHQSDAKARAIIAQLTGKSEIPFWQ